MNRSAFDPGPLASVDCHPEGDRWTLVFVRELGHPPEKVWAALTERAQVGEWSPFVADRDLDSVGDATLTMIDGDTSVAMPASMRRVQPPTLLEYTWGEDLLRWELAAVDAGTRLTLRHTVAERDLLPKVAAGWHLCLAVAEYLLDGRPIGPIRGSAARDYGWDELNNAYAQKLAIVLPGI
jgi:uncharacterized protein YndB with AHSA1/START domain